jgi:ABC-type multidrug transport system ATPase subunit
MLSRLLMPSSGTATIMGYDIKEKPLEIKKSLAYRHRKQPLQGI